MNPSDVLIRPVLTEKANKLSEKSHRYTFAVARKANKLEISKAVEAMYNVTVAEVKTMVVPAKNKSRYTKAGIISGRKPSYKKAVVVLSEGDTIDIFENL
ncbi:MAG: 50S ribosomal protein L23 [Chitinophagaceae bacterium]|jgi:large subunit ribosomal protein L23|nr:MAG: 50S ribosomal protein L23 [Chitinophagaceae bacterium]